MTHFRSLSRGPLAGPVLSLVLLWAGVAVPLMDRDLAEHSVTALSDGAAPSTTPSHDHRLCLLLQSSPVWVAAGPSSLMEPVVIYSAPAPAFRALAPSGMAGAPSARGPPFPS